MLKKPIGVLLLWLLITVAEVCADENPPLQLNINKRHFSLAGHLNFYSDTSAAETFKQANQAHYRPVAGFPGGGYSAAAHWYHFTLVRTQGAPHDWILALGEPFLDDVQVWLEQADGHFEHHQLGDHTPFLQHPLPSRLHALLIALPENQPVQVYVRIHSISALTFNAALWHPDAFLVNEVRYNFLHGLYFGVLIIIVFIHAAFGIWQGQTAMLAYAGYVATLLVAYLGTNGYAVIALGPESSWVLDAITGAGVISTIASVLLMWDQLLQLKQHFPRIHRFYLAGSLVTASTLPFVTTPFYRIFAPILYQFGLASGFFSLGLLLVLWLKTKQTELLFYLLAFVVAIFGAAAQIAMICGWLPQNIVTSNIYQVATLIHIVIMSAGLALRMRQLQQKKDFAESESAIDKERFIEQRHFVAMLSHEFSTPLAAIDRSVNLIQVKHSSLSQQEADRLTGIRASVAHIAAFVNSFLLSEALDHKALVPTRKQLSVKSLMLEIITSLGDEAKAGISLMVIPPDAVFELDKELISIAISNLLANALNYSNSGTKVRLAAMLKSGMLELHIIDHGAGLSEKELALLGTPYFRASTSTGKKGSGLGFYFTRRIIEVHEGSLTAFNHPSDGFTVQVLLPKPGCSTKSLSLLSTQAV